MTIFNMHMSRKFKRKEAKPINIKKNILWLAVQMTAIVLLYKYVLAPELAKWVIYYGGLLRA